MLNIEKTLSLIKNGLLDPRHTWQSYLSEAHSWKETAILLTLPLIVISVLLSGVLGWTFKNYSMFAIQSSFLMTILGLIAAIAYIFIGAFIFSFLAGVFEGKHNFNKGFAAISLAAIPGYIGSIISPIPLIGWIIALVLSILGLVYLYKIIPSYLEVPQSKRAIHFIVSLVSTVVIIFGINMMLGFGVYSIDHTETNYTSKKSHTGSGIFSNLQHQSNMTQNAEQDRFTPPKDGYISEAQMKMFVSTMQKSSEYINRKAEGIKEYEKSLSEKKDFDFSDLAKLSKGVGTMMSLANAEIEVVKSGGGNWAEHQWIKEQLHKASIHKELNKANKHNYALYEQYRDELKKYGIVY